MWHFNFQLDIWTKSIQMLIFAYPKSWSINRDNTTCSQGEEYCLGFSHSRCTSWSLPSLFIFMAGSDQVIFLWKNQGIRSSGLHLENHVSHWYAMTFGLFQKDRPHLFSISSFSCLPIIVPLMLLEPWATQSAILICRAEGRHWGRWMKCLEILSLQAQSKDKSWLIDNFHFFQARYFNESR